MSDITISKAEYRKLKQQANAYRKLTRHLFESIVKVPIEDVIENFRSADLYTDDFLKDLEEGLRKSSYGKMRK